MSSHLASLLSFVVVAPLCAQGESTAAVVTPDGVFYRDTAGSPTGSGIVPTASPRGLRWVYAHPSWISRSVSVGNHGTLAWLGQSLNNERISLLSTTENNQPPTVIHEIDKLGVDTLLVKAADQAPYVAVATITQNVSTLEFYSGFSATPLWTHTINAFVEIDISETGRYVAAGFSPTTTTAQVDVYDAFSATPTTPIATLTATTHGLRQLDLSDDGSTLLMATNTDNHVFDVASQMQIFADSSTVSHDAHAISRDGSAWGRGGFNPVRAWVKNGGVYNRVLDFNEVTLGFAVFTAAGISNDGSTFVAAAYDAQSGARLRVYCWALTPTSSSLLWSYASDGTGTLQTTPQAVSIADDGSLIAVGSWGDQNNVHAEALLFTRSGTGVPLASIDTPGSVFDLDLSGDGQFLVIGTKSVHANISGRGGEGYSFDLGGQDHWLEGTASISRSVDLQTAGGAGESVWIAFAGGLGPAVALPGIAGTFELNLGAFFGAFPAGTVPAMGPNKFIVPIPNVAALVGQEIATQALHGAPYAFTNPLRLPITP